MHLLTAAALAELPADARILSVGAGTGAEILFLAERFPQWTFTAVEPSAPMLQVCRRRADAAGITDRCSFHQGFLATLPPASPFDAATSVLVSQFVLDRDQRHGFFREIHDRLRPEGMLVSADLRGDLASAEYLQLLDLWLCLLRQADAPAEMLEKLRTVYGTEVAVLPAAEIAAMIEAAGFTTPRQFYQGGLIHG